MIDQFADFATSLDTPARDAFAIVPADGADLAQVTRALYVGVDGDLAVTMAGGAEVVFENVAAGTVLPVRVRRVHASGTSADALVGLV